MVHEFGGMRASAEQLGVVPCLHAARYGLRSVRFTPIKPSVPQGEVVSLATAATLFTPWAHRGGMAEMAATRRAVPFSLKERASRSKAPSELMCGSRVQ